MEDISRRRFLANAGGALAGLAIGSRLANLGGKATRDLNAALRLRAQSVVSPVAYNGDLSSATIVVAIPSGPEADTHNALASEFTKYTKGKIKVVVEEQSRTDAFETKFLTLMNARSSEWDVVRTTPLDFLLWGPKGWLVSFNKFMAQPNLFNSQVFKLDDYPPAIINLFKRNGGVYSFIQTASALLLYYRKDLLAKYAGVPAPPDEGWSITELKAVAQKMKSAGLGMYPFFFEASAPDGQAYCTAYCMAAMGGAAALGSGLKPDLATSSVESVFDWSISLQKEGLVPPGIESDGYSQGIPVFQNEQVAMGLQWDAAAATVLSQSQSPKIYDKMGFAPYPYDLGGPSSLRLYPSVWGLGISSYSKNQEAAFAYISWFTSPDIAKQYISTGGGTTGRTTLLNEPSIVAQNPQYVALSKGLKIYKPLPPTPAAPYVVEVLLDNAGSAIWSGSQSVASALATYDKQALSYLKEEGITVS
ncbi:MAG TPA: extracellular solute-binding protein [Acidimicrobiales bacterium]|nr:extracellular solute-binding protein [Acidimicrobiales bacterium]